MSISRVPSQKCGTLEGMGTRRGMAGKFWGAKNILFLDLSAGHPAVFVESTEARTGGHREMRIREER